MNIAFTVTGSGPPLVYMAGPVWSTLGGRAAIPAWRAFDERLEQSFQVIRYDSRGCGLSTRTIESLDLAALVKDVEAIVEKLQLEQYFIYAEFDSGPAAITLAHRYPDRVRRLVLWCTWARSLDVLDKDAWSALNLLVEQNLQLYLETVAQGFVSGTGLDARAVVQASLPGIEVKSLKVALESSWFYDVSELLGDLACPCLVLHRQGLFFPVEQSARLAAAIPNGHLIVLPGAGGVPWAGEIGPVVDAIEGFLLPDRVDAPPVPSAFRTILFTDLVGHTEMMSRLGDSKGRDVLREHERITRNVLKQHGGTEVKTMGDGFMASFGSVTKAVECAIALQRAFAERNRGVGTRPPDVGARRPFSRDDAASDIDASSSDRDFANRNASPQTPPPTSNATSSPEPPEPLNVRVGLNAGEPIEENGDLFGATVILASRIAAKASGGEILVADTVRGCAPARGFYLPTVGTSSARWLRGAGAGVARSAGGNNDRPTARSVHHYKRWRQHRLGRNGSRACAAPLPADPVHPCAGGDCNARGPHTRRYPGRFACLYSTHAALECPSVKSQAYPPKRIFWMPRQ